MKFAVKEVLVVQVQLPGYLKSLPLPKSIGGFGDLNREEWLELLPFILFLVILLYLVFSPFLNYITRTKQRRPRVNRKIKLNEPKVATVMDIEDVSKEGKDKVAFCRCWRSNKV